MSLEKILFIPDTHSPYHDVRAINLVRKVAKRFKASILCIGGDFADFYAVSSHSKDPERVAKIAFKDEIAVTKELLMEMRKWAPRAVFVEGNHEDRFARYIAQKAPELRGIHTFADLLGLHTLRYEVVPYKTHIDIGSLSITHDCGNAGKYAHYQAMQVFQGSVVINHTHRMGYAIEGDAQGVGHVGAMFGWLGDVKQIDYMHRIKAMRDWALGFGIGYHDPKSNIVYLQPIPIINYTCVVEGKLYVEA